MMGMSQNSETGKSKESVRLTDGDLAGVSGGARKIDMPPTTVVEMPPIVITGKKPAK